MEANKHAIQKVPMLLSQQDLNNGIWIQWLK